MKDEGKDERKALSTSLSRSRRRHRSTPVWIGNGVHFEGDRRCVTGQSDRLEHEGNCGG